MPMTEKRMPTVVVVARSLLCGNVVASWSRTINAFTNCTPFFTFSVFHLFNLFAPLSCFSAQMLQFWNSSKTTISHRVSCRLSNRDECPILRIEMTHAFSRFSLHHSISCRATRAALFHLVQLRRHVVDLHLQRFHRRIRVHS